MSEVKFSKEHEWITVEGDVATIGITKHATEMLGDIVFAELPEKGSNVEKDGTAGVVESTKAASDVYTPVSGEVVETNQTIVDDPAKINEDPRVFINLCRIIYYCLVSFYHFTTYRGINITCSFSRLDNSRSSIFFNV